MRKTGAIVVFLAVIIASLSLTFVSSLGVRGAVGYSMVLTSNSPSYSPGQAMQISGTISPAPGPDTGVFIEVKNPGGSPVLVAEATVGADNGSFSFGAVAGGTSSWTAGVYDINATWGAHGTPIFCTRTFGYGVTANPTFQCTPSATTSTSIRSSTTSTSASTTSSMGSTTSSTITITTSSTASSTSAITSSASSTTQSATASSTTSTSRTASASTSSMASTTSTTSSAATGLPWLPLTLLAAGVLIVAVIVVAIYRRVSRPK